MAELIQTLIILLNEKDLHELKAVMNGEFGYLLFHSKLFLAIDRQLSTEAIDNSTQLTGQAIANMLYSNIDGFKELANFRGEIVE